MCLLVQTLACTLCTMHSHLLHNDYFLPFVTSQNMTRYIYIYCHNSINRINARNLNSSK